MKIPDKAGWLLIIIFLFFSCSTPPVPDSGKVNIPKDFLGFVHAGESNSPEEYQLLDEMGVTWILVTFYWSRIEREQGKFNYEWYDNYVNTAKANGKKIIAVLAYSTDWVHDKRYISNENIPLYLSFAEAVVNHFKGRVDAWQIWNEPNWIFWKGKDREFFELSRQAAKKLKETYPDTYIIGGGFWRTPVRFIKGMNKTGATENLDALSFHPYGLTPAEAMKLYDKFIKTLSGFNFSGDIWVTEVGYPTGGRYPNKVTIENLPSCVIKTIAGSAARGVKTLLWYELFDKYNLADVTVRSNSEHFFGLTYPDYTWKNGAWAYSLCSRFLSGSQYLPELPQRDNIPSNIISFCFTNGTSGGNSLILWNDKNIAKKIKITVSSSFTIHDISTGKTVDMPDESFLDITKTPVFITWHGSSKPVISNE